MYTKNEQINEMIDYFKKEPDGSYLVRFVSKTPLRQAVNKFLGIGKYRIFSEKNAYLVVRSDFVKDRGLTKDLIKQLVMHPEAIHYTELKYSTITSALHRNGFKGKYIINKFNNGFKIRLK